MGDARNLAPSCDGDKERTIISCKTNVTVQSIVLRICWLSVLTIVISKMIWGKTLSYHVWSFSRAKLRRPGRSLVCQLHLNTQLLPLHRY